MALLRSILLTCAAAILVMHSLLPHLHQNEADNNVANCVQISANMGR